MHRHQHNDDSDLWTMGMKKFIDYVYKENLASPMDCVDHILVWTITCKSQSVHGFVSKKHFSKAAISQRYSSCGLEKWFSSRRRHFEYVMPRTGPETIAFYDIRIPFMLLSCMPDEILKNCELTFNSISRSDFAAIGFLSSTSNKHNTAFIVQIDNVLTIPLKPSIIIGNDCL